MSVVKVVKVEPVLPLSSFGRHVCAAFCSFAINIQGGASSGASVGAPVGARVNGASVGAPVGGRVNGALVGASVGAR